jgi:uncharacterized coiled-coil DUF342 family protein
MSNLIRQSHEMQVDRLEEEKHESWEENKRLYEKIDSLNAQVTALREAAARVVLPLDDNEHYLNIAALAKLLKEIGA